MTGREGADPCRPSAIVNHSKSTIQQRSAMSAVFLSFFIADNNADHPPIRVMETPIPLEAGVCGSPVVPGSARYRMIRTERGRVRSANPRMDSVGGSNIEVGSHSDFRDLRGGDVMGFRIGAAWSRMCRHVRTGPPAHAYASVSMAPVHPGARSTQDAGCRTARPARTAMTTRSLLRTGC